MVKKLSINGKQVFSKFLLIILMVLIPSSIHSQSTPRNKEGIFYDGEITPSQPYSIWLNINKAIIDYAKFRGLKAEEVKEIESLEPNIFYDKSPSDVIFQVGIFLDEFSQFSGLDNTTHGNSLTQYEGQIFNLLGENGEIKPSMVFLRSIVVLDFVVQDIAKYGGKTADYSQYYQIEIYENKTPSHVYGLVNLAIRKLNIIKTSLHGA